MRIGLLLALMALVGGTACSKSCEVPENLPRPMLEGPTVGEPRRLLPIGGYTLALSWVPQHCATRMNSPRDQIQCSGKTGDFGFVLHGLWPDGEGAQWPQYCATTRLVSEEVVREQLCTTPSVQLIQHQWEKHGTCMAKTPEEYFARGRALYAGLRFPDMDDFRGATATVAAFRTAFANANKEMRPDQIRLKVSRDGWLEEVMICLDKTFERETCPATKSGAAAERVIRIR